MIGQLEFSLAGEIGDDRALPATLLSGDVEGRSCPSGEVDRVGLQ